MSQGPTRNPLESWRMIAGYASQRSLAQAVGCHHTAINRLESGERAPTWQVACRVADALGCSMDEVRSAFERIQSRNRQMRKEAQADGFID